MKIIKPKFVFILVLFFVFYQSYKNVDYPPPAERTKQNIRKRNRPTPKDTLLNSGSIFIKAISDDAMALQHISFLNYAHFTGANPEEVTQEQIGGTAVLTIANINQPQILEIFAFGNTALYNTRLFVSPGDSIVMSLQKGKITFSGQNASHYNFFSALDAENDDYLQNPFQGDLSDYKSKTQKIYARRAQFFQQYISKHKVSDEFTRQVNEELTFEYLFNLMAPRSTDIEDMKGFVNNPDFLEVISGHNISYGEGLPNLKTYIEAREVSDFNRPELINNDYFKRSLISYIRFYFTGHEYLNYSLENFTDEKTFIENNYTGPVKDYALTRLIYDYRKKGFGNGKAERKAAYDLISNITQTIKNTSYIQLLEEVKDELDFIGDTLPEAVFGDLFENTQNDTITFEQIKFRNKGKTLVLDFWASWCSPCLKEIRASVSLRNELEAQSDVVWVFISTDHHSKNWLNGLKGLSIVVNNTSQYRMLHSESARLIGYLTQNRPKTFLIPRYVIIAPNGEVISANAPRPSDYENFKNVLFMRRFN